MAENISGVEKKVEKMLELIKDKDEYRKDGSELVQLVEDFHKQYQSLYALYNNLKGESEKPAPEGKGEERLSPSSSSSSSSDEEYYSPDATEARRSLMKSEHQKEVNAMKEEESETANEVTELKNQLVSKTEETEALVSDYMADLSSIQEVETNNRNLRNEVDEREKGLAAILGMCELSSPRSPGKQTFGKRADLEKQISNLKNELETLFSQKRDLVAQIVLKDTECKQLGEKNRLMESRILEFQQLTKKGGELEIQLKNLKEELSRKTAAEEKLLLEKESLLVQVKNLKSEVETFHEQKSNMEEEIRSEIQEISRLKEENEGVQKKILELEKGSEFGNEASVQILNLKAEIDSLQEKLDISKSRNRQLERDLEEEREGYSQSLSEMEDHNVQLTSKIADQQRTMDEQEKTINKFKEDSKLLKRWSWSVGTSSTNHHVLERKMEDLAEEFRKKQEDNIRLLYQRIRVAEKIHYETKENCQKIKDKYEQENAELKERVAIYEAESKKLRTTLQPGLNALLGLDLAVKKLEDNGNYLTWISKARNDLISAKNWASAKNNEVKQLRSKMNSVVAQLEDKLEQEFLLREKLWNMEASRSEVMEEKMSLIEAVRELEAKIREKDEEKREVIRQLCLLIDYHHSRYNSLIEMLSKSKSNVVKRFELRTS